MAQQVPSKLISNKDWLDKVQNVFQENIMSLFEKFYQGAHDLVYSSATTTAIIVIACYWLLNTLKNGYPTRDEIFTATKYIIWICIIFALLSSFNAYQGALYILTIPENIVRTIIAQIYESKDFGGIVTESINRVHNIKTMMWDFGIEQLRSSNDGILKSIFNFITFDFADAVDTFVCAIFTFLAMIPFWIFYISFWLLMIGIIIVILFSSSMAFLILSTLPIVIPFLIVSRFRPYLWSWYKLYLSFAFIAPLSFIILNLAMNPILELEKYENAIQDLFIAQFEYLLPGTITCIVCVFILKKIPSWINAVLGTQMEHGAGGVAGGVVAGAVAGKTMLGGMIGRITGQGFLRGLASGFGGATGTKSLSKAIVNSIDKNMRKFKGGVAVP